MSEFQSYEFVAVDQALDQKALRWVRQFSTRASLSPRRFFNTYEFGDFRGDPREVLLRHYDLFLHLTNFGGARSFWLRVPAKDVNVRAMKALADGFALAVERDGASVLVEFNLEESREPDDLVDEPSLWDLAPIRQEILAGDLHSLSLVASRERRPQTAAQEALVRFLELDLEPAEAIPRRRRRARSCGPGRR